MTIRRRMCGIRIIRRREWWREIARAMRWRICGCKFCLARMRASGAAAAAHPRALIQEAMARHHLEKNPEDFEAHYNLAALLQARGDIAGSYAAIFGGGAAAAERCRGEQWAWRGVAGGGTRAAGDSLFADGA